MFVIGIAGGTGSGKTTLANHIIATLGEQVCVLHHDDYYRRHDDLSYEERTHLNYDHPDSIETELMVKHIERLKQGEKIQCPVYDYSIHNRSSQTTLVEPKPILLIEGMLILADPELCKQMDVKIFVDADADVRILRRIKRDVRKRGRSLESVIEQYLSTVKEMHEQFVEPSKKNANIIVPEGGRNKVAQEMIIRYLQERIKQLQN